MRSHKSYSSVLLGLVFLALILTPAYSTTITTYTNLASWQAATGSFQVVNFEGIAPAGNYTQYTTPLTLNGVTFIGYTSGGADWLKVLDTTVSPYYNFGTGGAALIQMDRPSNGSPLPYIHVTLPTAVTSFAADLFSSSSNGMTFSVTTNQTGGSNVYTAPTYGPPTLGFFGVTSDTPFTSVDLWLLGTTYNGGSQAFIDNVRFGSASVQQADTPEAATFLLIGSGLIGLAFWRRRRNRVEPQERRQGTVLNPCVSGSTI